MSARSPYEPVLSARVFLLVSAVLNLVLHPMVKASWPDEWDPLGVRVVLSVASVLALAATWAPSLRRHASTFAVIIACLLQAWYLHVGHVNGLMVERALNAVMIMVGAAAVCRHLWQLGLFWAVTTAAVVWAYQGPGVAEIPQFGMHTTVGVIAVGIGLVIHYRSQLEAALASQVAHATALSIEVERRRHAEQAALQGSRAKSAFLAHMSHELRTPLTAILGYGELLEEELVGTDAEPLSEDVDHILVSGRHLLGLIDEVLDLARIESGKVQLHAKAVDLTGIVEGCLELVGPTAMARDNRLEHAFSDPVAAWGDAARIRQIVLNLVSNAIKFTQSGTVSLTMTQCGDQAVLAVTDTGRGIPDDALPTLFDPFVRVDADVGEIQGTGLGLAICRELAERMGGTLSATSSVGVGSTFTLTLPTPPCQSASQSTTSTV